MFKTVRLWQARDPEIRPLAGPNTLHRAILAGPAETLDGFFRETTLFFPKKNKLSCSDHLSPQSTSLALINEGKV